MRAPQTPTLWTIFTSVVVASGLLLTHELSAAMVTVQLRNGRLLTGEVDSRTDSNTLWLRATEPSIVVLGSTPWAEIRAARVDGTVLSRNQIQETLTGLKSSLPKSVFRRPSASQPPAPIRPSRVDSIEVIARVKNWDRDIEPDGLEVIVNPLSAQGDTVAIEGMATVKLFGVRVSAAERLEAPQRFGSSPREAFPPGFRSRNPELGKWNVRLHSREVTAHGYVWKLPFQATHPEYDLAVGLDGQVDVQLSVQGQGLQSGTTPVQLREFSPLRENLQLQRGTRFFPDEYTAG